VRYKDGDPSYLVMSKSEIEEIRDRSSQAWRNGKQDSPWFLWPEEMWRKTVVKRLIKYAELSPLSARAIGYDDQSEAGKMQDPVVDVDYSVLDQQMNPEAQVDPKVAEARQQAGAPIEPGGEGLKRKLGVKPKIPTFDEWPELFDGPELIVAGERYEFDGAAGNYRKVTE
jgi:recombinational DNA repair protein RecT